MRVTWFAAVAACATSPALAVRPAPPRDLGAADAAFTRAFNAVGDPSTGADAPLA
jgi:hypothetical protein